VLLRFRGFSAERGPEATTARYHRRMADPSRAHPIAALLGADPDPTTASKLLPLLYDELRQLARAQVQRLARGRTLQATDLVHEAWLRVARDQDPGWDGRAHFFGAAANAMRHILVDQARRRTAQKRDAGRRTELPDDLPEIDAGPLPTDVLALDDALEQLAGSHRRAAQVVTLKFFSGLEMAEIAAVVGVSLPTVERDWRFARAWLQDRLGAGELPDA
jgi:RNA polymerase sigma factor (TIGR02999 family)